jgi:hypothetical protein
LESGHCLARQYPAAPAGSEDLRLHGSRGLLLIVDYAETWPPNELAWLLGNSILHERGTATRVLLSRTADLLPVLRRFALPIGAEMSPQPVRAFEADAQERQALFTAARNRFADFYQLADASFVPPPAPLSDPSFGLPASLLVAALAVVDAAANGAPPPGDGLAYVLDRERASWARLHEPSDASLDDDDHRVRNAALALQTALTSRGSEALDRSVRTWREIVANTPVGHPDLAGRLSNLSVALQALFELGGDPHDLDEIVEIARQALAATPDSGPERAERQTNLATALQTRYRGTGHPADLDEAIKLLRRALLTIRERLGAGAGAVEPWRWPDDALRAVAAYG